MQQFYTAAQTKRVDPSGKRLKLHRAALAVARGVIPQKRSIVLHSDWLCVCSAVPQHDNRKQLHKQWPCYDGSHANALFIVVGVGVSWMFHRMELVDSNADVPLDLYAFGSVHVVAFPVCGKVLGVGRRSRLKILSILGQFQPFGFLPWLITEFYESHHHGQPQPSDQNIEDTSHIAKAESTCLVLGESEEHC